MRSLGNPTSSAYPATFVTTSLCCLGTRRAALMARRARITVHQKTHRTSAMQSALMACRLCFLVFSTGGPGAIGRTQREGAQVCAHRRAQSQSKQGASHCAAQCSAWVMPMWGRVTGVRSVGCMPLQSDLDNAIESLRLQIVDVAREHGRMIAAQVCAASCQALCLDAPHSSKRLGDAGGYQGGARGGSGATCAREPRDDRQARRHALHHGTL
jgi:hypothetical protein